MAIASRVLSYLDAHDIAFDIVLHPKSATSVQSAASAHIDSDHLAKAVLLQDAQGELLVVVPASRWVMLDRINKQLGRSLILAPEAVVDVRFDDCLPGAISPFGAAYGLDTLLDESLLSLAYVYFESGDHEQLLAVSQQSFGELMAGARHGHYCRQD